MVVDRSNWETAKAQVERELEGALIGAEINQVVLDFIKTKIQACPSVSPPRETAQDKKPAGVG